MPDRRVAARDRRVAPRDRRRAVAAAVDGGPHHVSPSPPRRRWRAATAPLEPSWAILFGLAAWAPWRRWCAVALVFLTVAAEVGFYTGAIPPVHVHTLPVSASAVPAALLALMLGSSLAGRRRSRDAFLAFWACAVVVLSVAVVGFSRLAHPLDLLGLTVGSVDEELVYRLALPVLLATALVGFGLPRSWCRLIGYTVAGTAWVLLPGHREQMHNVGQVLLFVEFALLLALICIRSGSVLATATVHTCANLLTVLMWREVIPRGDRSVLFGALLVLMLLAYGLRWRAPQPPVGDGRPAPPEVVDLRVRRPDTAT